MNILFSDYNPGGKLIFTLAKNDSDYGTDIIRTLKSNSIQGVFLDCRRLIDTVLHHDLTLDSIFPMPSFHSHNLLL